MNILISAFDSAYVGYAEMMYKSFSKFNSTKMYCCDCGLNSQDVSKIESLNVEILRSNAYLNVKDGRLFDMILEEFMIGLNWDKLMWADADTLFLKNVEHLFELDFDFIGHPGRNEKGLIIKSKDKCYGDVPKRFPDKNYFATGMWITRSRKLIKEFNDWINDHPNFKGPDCPPMTEIVNERYSSLQLDGNLYNFSRDIVKFAELEQNQICYSIDQQKYFPYTIGFSSCNDGKRLTSPGIEEFYDKVICT